MDEEATSVELLAAYECSDCGEMKDYEFTEDEAFNIIGGDERGFIRCPMCGEELEQTLAAALDMLELVHERFGQ